MRDLLEDLDRLQTAGPVGRAVVTSVWGSAPRPAGATLIATSEGRMAGSVSGGCVEAATVEAIREAMREGSARLVRFAVSDDKAWEVGLSCGGSIEIFVEPSVRPELEAAARDTGDAVVPSLIEGPLPLGAPPGHLLDAVRGEAQAALRARTSRTIRAPLPEGGEAVLFLEVFAKQPTLLIIGAVHVAESLARLARTLGFRVVVSDARSSLLTRERFPEAELVPGWPEEAFSRLAVDDATYVCVLTHDPKFDDPAVRLALATPAPYIGVIGSRKTQLDRRERLRAAGFGADALARVRGPIGLDLGGREPAEIALAILAEMTAVRRGRSPEGRVAGSAR